MTWEARARSIDELEWDGEISFEIPRASIGVVVGLATEEKPGFDHYTHAVQVSKGQYRFLESGQAITTWREATGDGPYRIVRQGGYVKYYVGDTLMRTSGRRSVTKVFVAAALLMPFDSVVDLQVKPGYVPPAELRIPELIPTAYDDDDNSAIRLELPELDSAVVDVEAPVQLDLPELVITAYDAASPAALTLPDLEMSAFSVGIGVETVRMWLPQLDFFAASSDTSEASLHLPELTTSAYGDDAWVTLDLPGLHPVAFGNGMSDGPRFDIQLKGFTDQLPEVPDILVADSTSASYSEVIQYTGQRLISTSVSTTEVLVSGDLTVESVSEARSSVKLAVVLAVESSSASDSEVIIGASVATLDSVSLSHSEVYVGGTSVRTLESKSTGVSEVRVSSLVTLVSSSVSGSEVIVSAPVATLDSVSLSHSEVYVSEKVILRVESVSVSDSEVLLGGTVLLCLESPSASESEAFVLDTGLTAWLLNTESEGVSAYTNLPVTGIVQCGDTVLGYGPFGIYVMDADTDEGAPIHAGITYGFTDFGVEQRKYVNNVYVGYRSDGIMQCTVEVYGSGHPPFTYEMPCRDAEAPTNNRIDIGKGLSGRYWRFSIDNVEGCDFSVSDLSALVASSNRRV